jgi:curved DNA-binding protein CbpA
MQGPEQPRDLYELLGVAPDARAAEITRAWHRRARVLHPDAQPGHTGAPARFQELEAAYRVLRDPARRAAYDQALRPPVPPAAARPAAPRWPGSIPPGAIVQAGPVHVSPPPGTIFTGDQADARQAVLVLLLARYLAPADRRGWPW